MTHVQPPLVDVCLFRVHGKAEHGHGRRSTVENDLQMIIIIDDHYQNDLLEDLYCSTTLHLENMDIPVGCENSEKPSSSVFRILELLEARPKSPPHPTLSEHQLTYQDH